MTEEVRARLEEALAFLRERGLSKNELETPDGRLCVNGALNVAAHGTSSFKTCLREEGGYASDIREPGRLLAAEAHRLFPDRAVTYTTDVSAFNNHPDTLLEDVELLFEKVLANS